MSDPIERYLVAQGLVGIALTDKGLPREQILDGMSRLGSAVSHPELRAIMESATPSLALAWAECGFPKLEPSHRLAASFMATSISAEVADCLELPWRAFAAEIPAGILDEEQHLILMVKGKDGLLWSLCSIPGNGTTPPLIDFGHEHSLGAYVNIRLRPRAEIGPEESFADFSWSRHERLLSMIGRFMIGVIAEIGEHRPSCTRPTPKQIRRHLTSDADTRRCCRPTTFKLTRSVSVDTRAEVRAYANGESVRSITTRCLVRGHWKMQPHGEQRKSRKLIHIEPYWRGDENSPIAIRSHIMDGDPR